MKFKNISETWGDAIEVTADDYKKQAAAFGVDVEITQDADGIYIDGEMVAEPIAD